MLSLPDEVLERVIQHLEESSGCASLSDLAVVSSRISRAVIAYRLRRPVLCSSAAVGRYLEQRAASARDAQALTIAKGTTSRTQKVKVGRTSTFREVEDSVTEDDVVKLCQMNPNLVAVEIVQPEFSSLRRRQISFASSLVHLRSLTIIGRSSTSGFNFSTIGQIASTLPRLSHLSLGNLHSSPTSLAGIPRPSFHLSTFVLFTPAPFLSPSQLSWLLASSTESESLQTLKFHLPCSVLPYKLHSVYWSPIRVTSLYLSSRNARAIEAMPVHCPHLERFEFAADSSAPPRVDARALLANARRYGRLREIRDHTTDLSNGIDLRSLAEGLLLYRKKLRIERVTIRTGRRGEDGFREAEEVCRILEIAFVVRDEAGPERRGGFEAF
ncbi:hypothetical protein JCM11491_003490 [Sporobolomyces phaffii]